MCCNDPVRKDVKSTNRGIVPVMNRKQYVDQLVERGFDRVAAEQRFQSHVDRGGIVEAVCCE